ncbi:MAG: hypothetical protein FJZ00_04300 [Candidatus Sericytochromatia bacterium]|uniref:Uncharacterized protein n=1 Tax=Candidatus Tanganyikabacteria bacterium TaxID=2961651 RepID=A0A937X4X6_9BACT|nr:hypothetical protein [Candidatus Tanganyikabacteria bacterium]
MSRGSWWLLLAVAVAGGCLPPRGATVPVGGESAGGRVPPLTGQVDFGPEGRTLGGSDRQTQASMLEIADGATVALIDIATNNTVGTTKTDPGGRFNLDLGGNFIPSGVPHYLEAVKGLKDGGGPNRVGSDAARVRTIVQFKGGWLHIGAGGLTINRSTTAISAIASLQGLPAASASALLGRLAIGSADNTLQPPTPDTLAISPLHGIANQDYHTVVGMVDQLLAQDVDPLAYLTYGAGTFANLGNQQWEVADFREGARSGLAVGEAGYLQLDYAVPPAPVPKGVNAEDYFLAQGVSPDAVGNVATDGQYLYVKCWSSYDANSSNAHKFKKIGTGFGGTTRGQNYGVIGGATIVSLTSAALPGLLFNTGSANNQLDRIRLPGGTQDIATLLDPQFSRHDQSLNGGGGYLLTSDGTLAYSTSYDDTGSGNDYWTLRILDPANNFSLVRQLTLNKGAPGFYTGGTWTDGTYYFPVEWTGGSGARLRRYRLSDGVMEAEWSFNQSYGANDPISGQYDWVNNKYWIGNLTIGNQGGPKVHMIKGGTFRDSGTWTSAALDTGKASRFRYITFGGDIPAGTTVSFQTRSGDSRSQLESMAWQGPTGTGDSYTTSGRPVAAGMSGKRFFQVRATLTTTDTVKSTPRLRGIKILYE